MRINRFELIAFGPFSDLSLDFSAKDLNLHIIYGPNEAGKSSALRALKAWLFGFPERTRDDFIHPRPKLLVGGELSQGGKTLTFFRRKKRKGDLVDADGEPMDPALLTPFLGGLDLALFESMHGIDHATLVRGGREILARQGELGETLFSAGSGLGSLHRVLEAMEAEKKELFLAGGRKPHINQGLRLHKKLKKEIRELSLAPEQWQEYAGRLVQISRELKETTGKRLELDRRRRHLERLHRAAPLLSRRKRVLEQQQALGPFRPLPPDFESRRSDIQQELRSARQRLDQARARQQHIATSMKHLRPHKSLISRAAIIEEAFQHLGEYRKAKKDRPRLEGMRAVLLKEADRLLRVTAPALSLQQAEQLMPFIREKRKILSLTSSCSALMQGKKDALARLTKAGIELEKTKKILAGIQPPGDASQLKMVVTRARKAGDIDERIRELVRQRQDREQSITLRLRQAGYWQGTASELLELELPLSRTIHLFRDELQEMEQKKKELTTAVRELEDALLSVRSRQRELIYGGEIPSEDELQAVRSRRDQGWQLVCRSWLEQEDISAEAARYAPDAELHETVHELILEADNISDRLRYESDRVHSFAALRSEEEELGGRLRENTKNRLELESALARHLEAWKILWQPLAIIPGTPQEMADWRLEMEQLQQLALELEGATASILDLEQKRKGLVLEIRASLDEKENSQSAGDELEPVLMAAEAMLDALQIDKEHFQRVSMDMENQSAQVRQAEHELGRITEELETWRGQWEQSAKIPGTASSFEPEAAQDLLDAVERIFSGLKEADELKSRMLGIDRDCLEFEEEVQNLVRETLPELEGQPVSTCVLQLYERLTEAGKEQALHEKYAKEAEELEGEIRENSLVLESGRLELDKLLAIAGCRWEEELIQAEQNAAEHKRLAGQLEEVEQDLQQIAGDQSIEELSQQVHVVDTDGLPGELHALELKITRELDPAIQTLAQQKGEAGKMLEQMDGSELAAAGAEELENNLARLGRNVERFLRLQVGVDMLKREIENFRRKNQDPVLSIASRLFAKLTLGSFSGLKTDVNDRGEPVLVGVRGGSRQTLGVEAMSTGSRDQLYLALRLAGLQHRNISGRSMPFIVDDILINFDDARGAATLQVLAGQGRSSQLILFTHHERVADQAAAIDGVQVHRLTR